uniref:auxin response factor 4-like n=1 Tax=Erigeron canadensis TaxID=72917 RepID=UPI001CB8E725|nr:auxin response factor 4-like [Erigeron canadensis]
MEIDLNHEVYNSSNNNNNNNNTSVDDSCEIGGDSSLSGSSNSSKTSSDFKSKSSSIYMELWHACAGPLTSLPNKGNVVVYFPQGHLEQIASNSTIHFSPNEVPSLGLQPQIFCKVVDVHFLANKENDEIYTKLTLLPLPEGSAKNVQEGEEEGGGVTITKSTPQMFCKTLTASDTSTHGGFSVPRRAAEDCFPPLDYKQQRPSQELVAKDLHGVEWKFRHIYRGQPRRHLLTTGWSNFVSQKNLASGDAVLFLRGESGELRLGTRRATRPRNFLPNTIFLNSNSFTDIVAPVANAVSTNSTFDVFYSPRSNRADFIVPYVKYMNSIKNMITIGTRFKMRFSMDESPERRFRGSVIAVGDMDPYKWPKSKWRCLTVRWDEDVGNHNQERISPWDIDLSGASMPLLSIQSSLRFKKLRSNLHSTPSEHPVAAWGGCLDFEESTRSSKVLQGQENVSGKMNNSLNLGVQPLMHPGFTPNQMLLAGRSIDMVGSHHLPVSATHNPAFLGSNSTRFPKVLQGQEICSLRSLTGKTNGFWSQPRVNLSSHQSLNNPSFYPLGSEGSRNFCFPNPAPVMPMIGFPFNHAPVGSEVTRDDNTGLKLQLQPNLSVELGKTAVDPTIEGNSGSEKEDGGSDSNGSSSCKLFGFHLNGVPPMADAQSLSKRSCTKVHKQGSKVGRAIDLSKMSSYHELFSELEALFQMEGILSSRDGAWQLLYTDEENDMMVVGDDPWDEFARMATKIHIYTKEEVEKLMSGGVISDDTSCLEEAPAMVDTAKSLLVGVPV